MRIFYATDIHGSEVCWKKFLNSAAFYKADLVLLGGDLTGKVMVPVIARGGGWDVALGGETQHLETREELAAIERRIRDRGSYPAVMTPDEFTALRGDEAAVDRRFKDEILRSVDGWLNLANDKLGDGRIPCIVNGGNDDTLEIDDVIENSGFVRFAEGRVIDLDGFYLASMGWTNPTPWDTYREAPEADLARRIAAVADQCPDLSRTIFNFHAPPHASGLDEAPALDENLRPMHGGAATRPVGSTAVRDAIENYHPLLSVHGHIHESRGIHKFGKTMSINPGSSYADGVLQGAVLDLDPKKKKVRRYMLVNG